MQFDKVYTVNEQIDTQQFLRRVMLYLAAAPNSPNTITDAVFGTIKKSTKEIIVCSARVETDYSASVGYNRQEQYCTTQTKSLSQGDYYTYNGIQKRADHNGMYEVDIVKTRTVTDWHPHSGHIGGNATGIVYNSGPSRIELDEHWELTKVFTSIGTQNMVEEGQAVLSSEGFAAAKKVCQILVEVGIEYPGDTYKDEKRNSNIDINTVVCLKLPYYEVEYEFEGKKYLASGFACNESAIKAQLPENNASTQAITQKSAIRIRKTKKALHISFWCVAVVALVIGIGFKLPWIGILPLALFVCAIVIPYACYKQVRHKAMTLFEDDVAVKLSRVKDYLNKHNLQPLTEEETKYFNSCKKDSNVLIEDLCQPKRSNNIVFLVVGSVLIFFTIVFAF